MKQIPLFVYGEENIEGRYHYLLKGATTYGSAHTVSPNYTMKVDKQLRNPVVFRVGEDYNLKAKIRGTLYGVSVEHIYLLDNLFRNGVERKRVQQTFLIERKIPGLKQYKNMSFLKAHIYLGDPSYYAKHDLQPKTRVSYRWLADLQGVEFFHHTNFRSPEERQTPIWNVEEFDEYGYYASRGYCHVG